MAEAIGLSSGIVTLAALALTVSQVSYDYLQKVRSAPKSVSRYLQEILALRSALLKVQETLALPDITSVLPSNGELLPKSLITECHAELEAIKRKLQKRSSTRSRWSFRSRVQDLTWPFQDKETLEMVEKLGRWNSICNSFVTSYNLQISNAALNAVQAHRRESKNAAILDWIYSDLSAISNDVVFHNHCESTCSWILEDSGFDAWLSGDGGRRSLFCTGDPGVGKTTMTSFLVNLLVSTSSAETCVLYHYFDFRAELQSHQSAMVVRHLLRQLLEHEDQLPQEVLTLYDRSIKSRIELTEKVWTDTFFTCVISSSKLYIILDGLDECPDPRGLNRFLRRLRQTETKIYMTGRASSHQPLDLVINHEVVIKAPQSDLVTYIKSYLAEDKDLSALLTYSLTDDIVLQLAKYADGTFLLVKLALENLSGVTTVRQVRESLLNLPQNLRSAHQSTFERIQSTSTAKRDLALKTLAWMLLAKRPLTMPELLHALAFDSNDSELDTENITTPTTVVRACLGFLEHRQDNDLVQFSHATVVQYLKSECNDTFRDSGLIIARSCVKYLAQPAFAFEPCQSLTELITRFSNYPLLRYTALYWGEHVFDFQTELAMDARKLLNTQNTVLNAAQAFHYLRRARSPPSDATFLELPQGFGKMHLLALWGLSDVAILESLSYGEIVAPDSLGWDPLHWAAARGHPNMIDFLLSRGASVEAKDFRGWTPLFWAVFWSRLSALRYLLHKGASLYAKDKDSNTPLHIAVDRGDPVLCRELLDRNADWSVKSAHGNSACEDGLASNVPEIASMFLALKQTQKSSVKEDDTIGETALERAVAWSPSARYSVFRTTLMKEAIAAKLSGWHRPLLPRLEQYLNKLRENDPNQLTDIGSDLHNSSFGADLINQKSYKAAVLGYAILTEHVEMVKALIDAGADLKKDWSRKFKRIEYMQFPVLLAAYVGNTDLISLLIRHGASVDVADHEGRSPLHYAAILGHTGAVHTLCSYEPLRKSTDREGKSPLHLVWFGLLRANPETVPTTNLETSLAIAELLAQSGTDIDLADRFGSTPLHDAVRTGRLDAVQRLVQLGANLGIRANKKQDYWTRIWATGAEPLTLSFDGDTPFTLACKEHKWDLASALHNAGAVLPKGMDLRSPLIRVIADGNLSALQTLFSFASAAQVAGSDTDQGIPLIILAVRSLQWVMDKQSQHETDFRRSLVLPENRNAADAPKRYQAAIEFLLVKEQNLNAKDKQGSTALLEALEYDYNKNIIDLLLAHGADIKATNIEGMNALHVAATSGFPPFVELMLSHDVNVNHVSSNGNTPLSLAATNGHEEVLSLLLEQPNIDASVKDQQKWLQLSRCYNAIKSHDLPRFHDFVSPTLPVRFSDRKGQTLLHLAADSGIIEMIFTLLTLSVDVNAQDIRGDTALHVAAKSQRSSAAVIKALIDGGADIQTRNFAGEEYGIRRIPHDATALHLAAYVGRVEIVRALLEHASKIPGKKRRSGTSQKPSDSTDFYEWEDISRRFIDWTSDRCGRTALMCAVQSGSMRTVKYLLETGANVNARGGRGSWGFCALDLIHSAVRSHDSENNDNKQSRKGDKKEVVKILRSYGAEEFDW